MATKKDLKVWVMEALRSGSGTSTLLDVAKHIWATHENELKNSGSLFYTWQYDMRWACTALRKEGMVEPATDRGVWKLVKGR